MAYSCSDFTDAVLDALQIKVPEADADNPAAQADLALAAIAELQRKAAAMPALVTALGNAEAFLCGFEDDDDENTDALLCDMRAAITSAKGPV